MRTLASTFGSRAEAEAAARRLEAIGIGAERIILQEVTPQPGAPPASEPGGVFVSVKVPTDQVSAVSEIMKSGSSTDGLKAAPAAAAPAPAPAAAAAPSPSPPPVRAEAPVRTEPEPPLRPRIAAGGQGERGEPRVPKREARPEPDPDGLTAAERRERLRWYLLLFCLALLTAFLVGAGLGMVS